MHSTGIIPARAGFTATERDLTRALADHPRSRGVYQEGIYQYGVTAGSSPLARGLLGDGADGHRRRGIILARAGFTPPPPRAADPAWGSSPLARGLQPTAHQRLELAGIIPARAGFTGGLEIQAAITPGSSPLARGLHPISPSRGCGARDHPRSRGVYPF